MAKLGEICTIYSGTGFPVQYQGNSMGKYPFYKVGDIARNVTQGYIFLRLCENFIDEDVCEMIKGTIIPENTIVFAKIGEAVKLNRRAITTKDSLIDNNAMGIKPNEAFIDLRYFYHFMCRLKLEEYAEATTVPSVKKTTIEKIDIPLPTLETQRKIATNLDKVTHTIDLCNAILEKLDLLVKSRFVEMFGDCRTNPKGWNTIELGNIAYVGSSKRVFVEELIDSGIPFYRGTEVGALAEGKMITPELFISQEHYEELIEATGKPIKGDLLMPSICPDGRIWVVDTDKQFYFKDGRVLWVHNINKQFDSIFLLYTLKDRIITDYQSIASGTTFAELKIFALKQCKVFEVPIEIQRIFSSFVEQTDKSKLAVKQVLQKAETLKKALMQEYFG